MSETIPTTQELVDQTIAFIESRLNQTTPASDIAYNAVMGAALGMIGTTLLKYAANRLKASFVASAQGADLDYLGSQPEYNTPRNPAVQCQCVVSMAGTGSTDVPQGTVFIHVPTGSFYTSNADAPVTGGYSTPTLTAQVAGASENANIGDTFALQTPITGITGVPTVTAVNVTGADAEQDPAYRVRLNDAAQSVATGSNAASYRQWGQSVAGVVRCYPYSGPPTGITPAAPPMRTVYVECATSIQADGIAPAGLLVQVRTAITTNAATGLANQDLGLTDASLYVQAIIRTGFYVTITALNVPSGQVANCQAAILAALTTYFLSITPFCTGVDPSFNRNDTITNPSVSKIVQAVLTQYGASAANIGFGVTPTTFNSSYQVGMGEKAKLLSVTYA